MDHPLRWRVCLWRMGGQDVMPLCSTSSRYVTSLEIRHFRWHNLVGYLGDESGRAMISSTLEVRSPHRPQRLSPQYLKSFLPFHAGSPLRRPQAGSGNTECGGPPPQIETDKRKAFIHCIVDSLQLQAPILCSMIPSMQVLRS